MTIATIFNIVCWSIIINGIFCIGRIVYGWVKANDEEETEE